MSRKLKKGFLTGVGNFFKAIYRFFDRILITPVTKVLMFIMRLFKSNNKPLERFLNNKIVLITLSLILAVVAFVIVDQRTNIILNKSADILYNQKVEALYNEEAYVVEGIPEKVDITLIGRQSDIYLAKQYPTEEVVMDLRGLKPGSHRVKLQYSRAVSSVEYQLNPATVSIILYEKVSESKKISSEILHEEDMDAKYSISTVSLNRQDVYIKGAKYRLDEVAVVKALVDVNNIVNPSVGTTVLKDVPLAAYNSKGEKIDIEIVPATVDATIVIQSPEKTVPLKIIPEGNVVFGKAINTMTLSKANVTIYGDSDAINNISSIPVKIDVSNLDKTKEFNVTLTKPNGVRDMSVTSVTIKVTLGDITESVVNDISIGTRNLNNKYVAQAASKEDSVVDVIVKGTSTVVKGLTDGSVAAYVDLTGLKPGTHEVDVIVTGEDLRITYVPKVKKVKIIIKEN